jgi:uncharacterized protein (TIGR00369 family)
MAIRFDDPGDKAMSHDQPTEMDVGHIPLELLRKHSGLDQLRMLLEGKLPPPPIARTLGFYLAEAEEGRAVFRGTPRYDHYNPLGVVHGGWTATLLDSALGCAVHTMLPAGMGYTTIEFKVNLVRPLSEKSGEIVCEGRIVHFGRTIATSEATLKTADGKLIAHGTETCAIFPLPPES